MIDIELSAESLFIKDANEVNFEQDVLVASMTQPIVVDFWSPRSEPCKQIMPVLEKLINDAGGKVLMVKVNVDQNQGLVQAVQIQTAPTVYAFFKGKMVDGFTGVKSETEIKSFIENLKPLAGNDDNSGASGMSLEDVKKIMSEADDFFQEEKYEDAMANYSIILDSDEENMEALGGIGWCLFSQDDVESTQEMLSNLSDKNLENERLKGLKFILSLKNQETKKTSDVLQLAYNKALKDISDSKMEQGIDGLINIVKQNREWKNKKAHNLLLEVFEAMGNAHPLIKSSRRKLSAILFS